MTELARPLETGWLPDTPIGDSLLRRFVANQADLQDHLVGAVGGRSDLTPDVALSDSGAAAAYLNQAVMLRPISDAYDAVLDHVAPFYAGSVGLLLSHGRHRTSPAEDGSLWGIRCSWCEDRWVSRPMRRLAA